MVEDQDDEITEKKEKGKKCELVQKNDDKNKMEKKKNEMVSSIADTRVEYAKITQPGKDDKYLRGYTGEKVDPGKIKSDT